MSSFIENPQGPKSAEEIPPGPVALCHGIAKKMTPSQIAEAQKLAREWKPKKE
jgi:hypothetical protein